MVALRRTTGSSRSATSGRSPAVGDQDPTGLHRQFFDRWLRDGTGDDAAPDRRPAGPALRHGRQPLDSTRRDWPPPDVEIQAWHLRGDGRANTVRGDGRSRRDAADHEAPDAFLYDPRDPVPTIGGATLNQGGTLGWNSGPWDQRPLEARRGRARLHVAAAGAAARRHRPRRGRPVRLQSSALDTDFTAKLVDVHPSGRAEILADGILRAALPALAVGPRSPWSPAASRRSGSTSARTANVFLAGHRVRLDVSSSNFPRFDANTNTGGTIADEGPGRRPCPPSTASSTTAAVHRGCCCRSCERGLSSSASRADHRTERARIWPNDSSSASTS